MALKNAGYTKFDQVFKFMIAEASIIVIGMTASIFAPSFAAVLIIASHSLISSFNLIYEINISAYLSISVFTGLMIKFWITEGLLSNGMERLKPKKNWQNILPLLPIIGTLLVGIYGESLMTNSGLNFEFNWSELLTLLQHPTSLVNSINVVTRWFSYGMIAYLGLKFTTPDRFLIQFALVCASQIFFFDTSYLIELYNQVKVTLIFPGFDWLAFNRAYFAYELSVSAASLFIFGSRETKKILKILSFCLCCFCIVLIAISGSKGPILALVISLIVSTTILKRRRKSSNQIYILCIFGFLPLCACLTLSYFFFHLVTEGPSVTALDENLRLRESVLIRFSIATSILEAQNLDMWNLFFGGGFGASRPGTHNFVLDIFVDTGLVGSTLFLITMGYLIITVYKKDARNLEFIALYSSLICVCLIKSLLASNTYSEPLLATLLAITLTKFFATKLKTKTK